MDKENKPVISSNKNNEPKLKRKTRFLKIKNFLKQSSLPVFIILWYSLLLYLLFGFMADSYSYKTFLFSFAVYLIYQVLVDDIKTTIMEIKILK